MVVSLASLHPLIRVLAATLAAALVLAACGSQEGFVAGGGDPAQGIDPIDGDPDPVPEGDVTGPEPPLPPPEVPGPAPSPAASPEASPAPTEVRRLCFSPKEDCVRQLLAYLQAENVGIDMAIYHLYDSRISRILLDKLRAGLRVRVIADRHAYNVKPQHAREMNFLASNGVPVRTNRFRGIVHHKFTVLHGLRLVEHGSMNYTSIASRRVFHDGRWTWNEEQAFFTANPRVVARFAERFQRMWSNTGDGRQSFQLFTAGMRLPTHEEVELARPVTCYEDPPAPVPVEEDRRLQVCFPPDQNCLRRFVVPTIENERERLDIFLFRATSLAWFGDQLAARVAAGLPVRIILEGSQYGKDPYQNMTTIIDRLTAANTAGNLEMKTTAHPGFMHMKGLVTPRSAYWASGNFSLGMARELRGCSSKSYAGEDAALTTYPELVQGMQQRFDEMWSSSDFTDFDPAAMTDAGEAPAE